MIWWWKSQLDSPDGATRNRAIAQFVELLDHPNHDRRHKALKLLAGIGHHQVVDWSMKQVSNRESAGLAVGLLTQIMTDFPHAMESEHLQTISELADPMEKLSTPPLNWAGKPLSSDWHNLRTVDCSELRQKATAELQRREAAEAKWRRADEERKQRRQEQMEVGKTSRTA
jgi:HEAT repeat protein